MTLAQKRAIGYAIREREEKKRVEYLKNNNEYENFQKSKYKTTSRYMRFVLKKNYI